MEALIKNPILFIMIVAAIMLVAIKFFSIKSKTKKLWFDELEHRENVPRVVKAYGDYSKFKFHTHNALAPAYILVLLVLVAVYSRNKGEPRIFFWVVLFICLVALLMHLGEKFNNKQK